MSEIVVIPKVIVHPDKIVCCKTVQRSGGGTRQKKFEHLLKSDRQHQGKVSDQARRKIGRAVEYLLFMSNDKYLPETAHGKSYKFKLAFVTLTLPSAQVHADNFIKKEIFNQFLIEAKNKWLVKNYIWRAEKQKNGSIHFHILVDKFIPWSELRDVWNRIINKHGYVDRYRDSMRKFHQRGFKLRDDLVKYWPHRAQVKAYQKGKAKDWQNPNSTDVHSLNYVHSVKNYIIKYITKAEKEQVVAGRMWGCSVSLSKIKGAGEIVDNYLHDEITRIQEANPAKVYHGDHFTVMNVNVQDLPKLGANALFEIFCNYLFDEFGHSVQTLI